MPSEQSMMNSEQSTGIPMLSSVARFITWTTFLMDNQLFVISYQCGQDIIFYEVK